MSPKHENGHGSLVSQVHHSINNSVAQSNSYSKGLANGAQIAKAARSRLRGMQNSHSNKKLPTWKGNSLLSEQFDRGGVADRSLDRMHGNLLAGGAVLQSRQELMQNEYKKIIENHPATIGNDKYDDTDFLQRMFTAKDEHQESSEVLHKSHSQHAMLSEQVFKGHTKGRNDHPDRTESAEQRKRHIKESKSSVIGRIAETISSVVRGTSRQPKNPDSTNSDKSKPDMAEFKPTSMFSLMGEKAIGQKRAEDDDVLEDDDVRKLDRLQLINASARYELLSANQQLIDFHLNRVMKSMIQRQ